ncbi:MAG: hypothetical protein MK078_07485 [Crocinitomicaceae bacterium]|nr:hypothetical protein [Crocinitomicaceae bacterium]
MNTKTISKSILALGLVGLVSCGGEDLNTDENKIIATDTTTEEIVEIFEETTDYGVPTPNEFFEVIKLQGGEMQGGLVNPLENQENYITQVDKALNFGIYSADLAYMSCFGIGTEFLKYFKAIEDLGTDIGISGAFDEDLMDRIENNEGDTDSLFAISNQSYYDSYLYLEENELGVELSLIMASGYIESLYIVCNVAGEYNAEDPIIEKIGDQKIVLENLLDFIATYADDQDVANIYGDLADLDDVFTNNMDFEESGSNVDTEDDVLMVTGGGSFVMNEKTLTEVTKKVTELRNNITNK